VELAYIARVYMHVLTCLSFTLNSTVRHSAKDCVLAIQAFKYDRTSSKVHLAVLNRGHNIEIVLLPKL
jgi:hypothetical protein